MSSLQDEVSGLKELLGAVERRTDVTLKAGGFRAPAQGPARVLLAALKVLGAPASAAQVPQWLTGVRAALPKVSALALAALGAPEAQIFSRAASDIQKRVASTEKALQTLAPPVPEPAEDGPPVVLLAGGAAAAFALAWFLFRERSGATGTEELEAPAEEIDERPSVEYLPPEPSGPHESYELEEIEDAEFEPA